MYLPPEATAAALRAIAGGLAGTTLVVNFLLASARSACWDTPCATVPRRRSRPPGSLSWLPIRAMKRPACWAGVSGIELSGASRLRDRYLRDRPDLPLPGTTVIAVATVQG